MIARPTRPRISVVLSSGGIKPLAAIPLFEFLDRESIPVDLLVGCSGGSIMSALRGFGCGTEEILAFFKRLEHSRILRHLDFRALLGLAGLPFGRFNMQSGLVKPGKLHTVLRETFGDCRIEDLKPKTLIQATDVGTGEGVILDRGLVREAVYASSALFPLLPPLQVDGRWLSDGYYTSPLPVAEAVKQQMDVIIAVLFYDPIDDNASSYIACLSNYYTIQGDATTRYQMALSIGIHDHEIIIVKVPFRNPVNIWDAHYIPEIIELGRTAIEARKRDILSAIAHFA